MKDKRKGFLNNKDESSYHAFVVHSLYKLPISSYGKGPVLVVAVVVNTAEESLFCVYAFVHILMIYAKNNISWSVTNGHCLVFINSYCAIVITHSKF